MSDFIDGMEAHIEALRRYALALVGNSADADDLVQESLRRVLSYVEEHGRVENWRAYLHTTLHNVFVSQITSSSARNQVSLEECSEEMFCSAPQHTQIECQDLGRELLRLPVDQREVVLLVALEGYSYKEVADMLGIPLGTVMSRLNRGRIALRLAMTSAPAPSHGLIIAGKADIA
jgi:RNA polymerase sigma-70 factor (ECF subfamily)